jgi:hypothetical protein
MLAIVGCEGPVHPNYFDDPSLDPFPTGGEPPVIATVSPDRGFAGDEIVITGGPFPLQMRQDPGQRGQSCGDHPRGDRV